jgi:hypothetical protein
LYKTTCISRDPSPNCLTMRLGSGLPGVSSGACVGVGVGVLLLLSLLLFMWPTCG